MINFNSEFTYPTATRALIENRVASRIRMKDATLYDFSPEAEAYSRNFMGWATLASEPPVPIDEIKAFAQEVKAMGYRTVILLGQGGSTQAPMTLTKYNKPDSDVDDASFKTMDSISPVRLRAVLRECDPQTTLIVYSSKSGGTIEPNLDLKAICTLWKDKLPMDELPKHLVAITDPGSDLERRAVDEGWLRVFLGEPTVGGRYSALSVFGLVPAALVGIDLDKLMAKGLESEVECSTDSSSNPAIALASFLYENYAKGRDKFAFITPRRGRVLGLWIEQLVAESLGKDGKGILPNIEVNPLSLFEDPGDRTVVYYRTKVDSFDERINLAKTAEYIDPNIPRITFELENVEELASHFVMWEYATAMIGHLMQVSPFDQPDVQIAKTETLRILAEGETSPTFTARKIGGLPVGKVQVRVSKALMEASNPTTLEEAVSALYNSIRKGDYFTLNAFLPFDGEGRREALEEIRHAPVATFGLASCMEVGPRYLHSTGQMQKGGPNNGVHLILSSEEAHDVYFEDPRAQSLGALAKAQAMGDFSILSDRGRRCVYLHLPDHSAATLRSLAELISRILIERLK